MTAALIAATCVLLPVVALLSALSRSLVQVSESTLERTLEELGRLQRGRWIFGHLAQVEWAVAFLRTAGRMGVFALVLAVAVGVDEPLSLRALLGSWIGSAAAVWLFSSVVGGAFARYAPAEAIAAFLPLLHAVYLLLAPLRAVADGVDGIVRRIVAPAPAAQRQEEELLSSIEDTQRQGAIDRVSAAILENTVEFGDTTVGAVMTPRPAVEGIEYTDDLAEIREFIRTAGHSRIPVFRGSLDHIEGVLYVKDLVPYLGRGADGFQLRPLLRQPMRVPESRPVREQLLEFQRANVHLAIVIDEFGGTAGLVTIEDVIEELVGEIRDEHEPAATAEADLRRTGDRAVEASGRTAIRDLNAALGIAIPEDEGYETVAGFVLARLGKIPRAGERFEAAGARFEILGATPSAILLVRAETDPQGPGADATHD
ncbi:MAG: hemolysin family protein [Phycisphaerales bacterium]